MSFAIQVLRRGRWSWRGSGELSGTIARSCVIDELPKHWLEHMDPLLID